MLSLYDWCQQNNRTDLLRCYDKELNPEPNTIAKGTHAKYHWICDKCGTKYLRSPHSITINSENGCPNCHHKVIGVSRHRTAVNKYNFAYNYPKIAEEWDYEKNEKKPDEVSYNDNHQYYWRCKKCGESFKSVIINRVKGSKCPRCNAINHTSFPEQAIFFYISEVYPDAISRDKHIGRELDIYIPSENIGIEYDGVAWHKKDKNIENDTIKEIKCRENGIKLIRIREKGLEDIEYNKTTTVFYVESGNDTDLEMALINLFRLLGQKADIDIARDKENILKAFISAKENNSLLQLYPEIAKEWDYSKNKLSPEELDYGSGFNAWWICPQCGFSYKTTVNARTCKESGCPACQNRVINPGVNDFITWCNTNKMQYLLQEWDYEANETECIDINAIINRGGSIVANWICPKGHKYKMLVYNRTIGKGCKKCAHLAHQLSCRNVETGESFNSLKEAGLKYGIQSSKISEVCKGKRRTAGGYHWKYCDDSSL